VNVKQKLGITAVLLILCLGIVTVWAQTSGSYDLSWHVVGSGGGLSSSASYSVNGTGGQSAASPALATSSNFVVSSGYWYSHTTIYLPFIQKD
jgi:hypothetical protein